MRVIVTGASGFIGSFIASSFVQAGDDVIGVYRETAPAITANNFRALRADLSNAFFKSDPCDLLIHCAAVHPTGNLPPSAENLIKGNVNAALNLAAYINTLRAKKTIFLSSLSVYGKPYSDLVTEDTLPNNPDLYGLTKILAESIFKECALIAPVISVRLPGVLGKNNFGPWIGRTLALAKQGKPIKLYNGSAVFNHATDLQDIYRLILLLAKKSWNGFDVVNLGAEPGLAVIDIVKRLIQATQSRSEVIEEQSAQAQARICLKKLIQSYGFRPSSLEEMLGRYLGENLTEGET